MPASVAKGYEDRLRAGETILLRGELAAQRPSSPTQLLSQTAGPVIAAPNCP